MPRPPDSPDPGPPAAHPLRAAPIRVALVEDQPPLRRQLMKFLTGLPDIAFLSAFASAEEALAPLLRLRPDVLVLDLELPGMSGLELLREIKPKAPEIQVLILTTFDDEQKVYEAVQAGASGYLVKQSAHDRLPGAIATVVEGGTVIDPPLARRFWNYFQSVQTSGQGPGGSPKRSAAGRLSGQASNRWALTALELELLTFLAKGLSNAEVGQVLSIDRRTVRTHLLHLYTKLQVHSHVEAVVLALKAGLIEL